MRLRNPLPRPADFFDRTSSSSSPSLPSLPGCLLRRLPARRPGAKHQCISNQKQIGLAFKMYADDNRDFFPVHSGWGDVGGSSGPTPTCPGTPVTMAGGRRRPTAR